MSPESLKVLFISPQPFFEWRGSPIRVAFDVTALSQLGHRVDLLTLPVGEKKEIPGVRIIRVSKLPGVKKVPIGPSPAKVLFDIFLLFKGLVLARREKYNVIHCIEDAGFIGVIISRVTGAKLVFEKHSDPSSYRGGVLRNLIMWLYSKVEKFVIKRSAAVIGTGPGLVEQAKGMKGKADVYHIFDIPSSLVEANGERVEKIRRDIKKSDDEVLVTYVGSFARYQGVDLMFESIPMVISRNSSARFVIIGGTDDEILARNGWLEEKGVKESVVFLGKISPDSLPDYLSASDILLSPRIAGVNTPLKLLDYLKSGAAIAATDTEANRLILNKEIATLAAPDALSFANAVCGLIDDADSRKKLGDSGKKLIVEKYNFSEFKNLLSICYNKLSV